MQWINDNLYRSMMSAAHNNISMNSIPFRTTYHIYWLRLNNQTKIDVYPALIPSSHINNGAVLRFELFVGRERAQSAVTARLINTAWLIDNIQLLCVQAVSFFPHSCQDPYHFGIIKAQCLKVVKYFCW